MKKFIALLMAIVMVASLAACGNSSAPAATEAPPAADAAAPAEAGTAASPEYTLTMAIP